jgi:hypothetical protein
VFASRTVEASFDALAQAGFGAVESACDGAHALGQASIRTINRCLSKIEAHVMFERGMRLAFEGEMNLDALNGHVMQRGLAVRAEIGWLTADTRSTIL